MKPEDQKRLEREADIAKAVRGPDYSRLETEIARNKAEQHNKDEAGREALANQARGVALKKMHENIYVRSSADKPERSDDDRER